MITMALIATLAIAFLSLIALGTPYIVQLVGRLAGWNLRRLTQHRRELLLARVQGEREELEARAKSSSSAVEDEWEKVDKSRSVSEDGDEGDRKWNGIIGFFHPFWCVSLSCLLKRVSD